MIGRPLAARLRQTRAERKKCETCGKQGRILEDTGATKGESKIKIVREWMRHERAKRHSLYFSKQGERQKVAPSYR